MPNLRQRSRHAHERGDEHREERQGGQVPVGEQRQVRAGEGATRQNRARSGPGATIRQGAGGQARGATANAGNKPATTPAAGRGHGPAWRPARPRRAAPLPPDPSRAPRRPAPTTYTGASDPCVHGGRTAGTPPHRRGGAPGPGPRRRRPVRAHRALRRLRPSPAPARRRATWRSLYVGARLRRPGTYRAPASAGAVRPRGHPRRWRPGSPRPRPRRRVAGPPRPAPRRPR